MLIRYKSKFADSCSCVFHIRWFYSCTVWLQLPTWRVCSSWCVLNAAFCWSICNSLHLLLLVLCNTPVAISLGDPNLFCVVICKQWSNEVFWCSMQCQIWARASTNSSWKYYIIIKVYVAKASVCSNIFFSTDIFDKGASYYWFWIKMSGHIFAFETRAFISKGFLRGPTLL